MIRVLKKEPASGHGHWGSPEKEGALQRTAMAERDSRGLGALKRTLRMGRNWICASTREPNVGLRVLVSEMTTLAIHLPLSDDDAPGRARRADRTNRGHGYDAADDGSLLSALRSRDRRALACVADRFGQELTRVAYLHLGDAHSAEDAAQDALLAAWDAAGRTSQTTELRPWLLGILLNVCRKTHRTTTRRRRRERAAHDLTASRRDEKPSAPALDRRESLARALRTLDEPMRAVVILRYAQDMSVADTAAALGLPQGTVKSRCHAALRRMREAFSASDTNAT